ncbi:putative transcriptional regulatory protein [Alphaproteobacteria bacterium]|nr:putative transcriptional regulatory protein [Alphaproteobacteria bacterium]
MSGHSQFKNIMYRKGAQDAKKARLFAKIAREITVSAKIGGQEASSNPRLRAVLAVARENNMPKDNIDRALTKALGADASSNYEEVRYEGYGPCGVAVIVEALTDNRNRTASEVRSLFAKFGGNLGETGSVSFLFDKIGHMVYKNLPGGFDTAFDFSIDVGAENVNQLGDGYIEIITSVENFSAIRDDFIKKFGDPIDSSLVWMPASLVPCLQDQKETLMKLIDCLEENDDVQKVFYNLDDE